MSLPWAFPEISDLEQLFAQIQVKDRIPSGILKFLDNCTQHKKFAIACSGGADSTFLTFLLFYKFPSLQDRLVLCHFNHRLRGEDSGLDEEFVQEMALHLGIPIKSDRQDSCNKADEASLRNQRIDFFKRMDINEGISNYFLGHHTDDIAETFIWRLPRSSTVSGLHSPKPISAYDQLIFLRPLLNFSRLEIREFLLKFKIPWREDQSNNEAKYLRNRIRKYVIPAWKESFECDLLKGIAKTRELLEQDAQALDYYCDKTYQKCTINKFIKINHFNSHPVAIRRRILRRWFTEIFFTGFSFDGNESELLKQIENGNIKATDLPNNIRVTIKNGLLTAESTILIEPNIPLTFLPLGNDLFLSNGKRIKAIPLNKNNPAIQKALSKSVDESKEAFVTAVNSNLFLRSRKDGDRFETLGSNGSKKVSKLMIDKKWSHHRKKETPLILDATGNIIWVPGFPPNENWKITAFTEKVIHLTYD
ncbi:MAG: tRNA lysidine(34) synthetase TilS [Opitutales bacterium]|nr:tRNA lysidine(34) synthetase TilS [Opitutales bacterium]